MQVVIERNFNLRSRMRELRRSGSAGGGGAPAPPSTLLKGLSPASDKEGIKDFWRGLIKDG